MSISFSPDEMKDVKRDFVGVIVAAEYALEPFGIKGGIERTSKVLGIKVRSEQYDKDQPLWYPPSNRKRTKWDYWIQGLATTGALKDVDTKGLTDEERMQNFARSLIGMKMHFVEVERESPFREAKVWSVEPVEYLGKQAVPEAGQIVTAEVGEQAPAAMGGEVKEL